MVVVGDGGCGGDGDDGGGGSGTCVDVRVDIFFLCPRAYVLSNADLTSFTA